MNPLDHPLFEFGRPPNVAAWIALGLGVILVSLPRATIREAWLARHSRKLCAGLALIAAGLSAAYFFWVLGGGPRIIDATAYLCAARIFASGSFTFDAPVPSSLFHARFLIHPPDAPTQLGVIFPPGYPAFLAIFERFFDFRLAGPTLAAAITLGTYSFARWIAQRAPSPTGALARGEEARARVIGLLAAALSVTSAALRYHTADTMSHGFSTLLTLVCGLVVAKAWSTPRLKVGPGLALGAALGLLWATRPLTALAATLASGFALWRLLHPKAILAALIGCAPGLALLFAYQEALTSSFWESTQLRYYALADGPASCFGLGFGKGCEFEHADVITERGKLGPLWALLNSLHRLHNHALDLANCEILFVFLLVRLVKSRAERPSRFLLVSLSSFVLLYSLFYFDGSYPGGGGRFLIELLPFEHALLALFAVDSLGSSRTLGISALGFALHGAYSHEALRARDGGAPFIDQALVEARAPRVVFVESDHAFLAGLLPAARASTTGASHLRGTLVARRSHDFREAMLLENLGSPPAFLLTREPPGTELIPWLDEEAPRGEAGPRRSEESSPRSPVIRRGALRWEAERDYPPFALDGLWVHPAHLTGPSPCAPSGRALRLRPQAGRAHGALTLWIDGVASGVYQARPIFWSASRGCFFDGDQMLSAPGSLRIEVRASPEEPFFLDRIELETIDRRRASPSR